MPVPLPVESTQGSCSWSRKHRKAIWPVVSFLIPPHVPSSFCDDRPAMSCLQYSTQAKGRDSTAPGLLQAGQSQAKCASMQVITMRGTQFLPRKTRKYVVSVLIAARAAWPAEQELMKGLRLWRCIEEGGCTLRQKFVPKLATAVIFFFFFATPATSRLGPGAVPIN